MAHRGRTYPNHFRRDFNYFCDVSNPTHYAKAYTIKLDSNVVPPYIVDGQFFTLVEVAGPDPTRIAWLSNARTIGIWLWQLRCDVQFFNLPTDERRPTWVLERDAIKVSSWRGNFDLQTNAVSGGRPLFGSVLLTDFTTFPAGANFNFSTVTPVGYAP